MNTLVIEKQTGGYFKFTLNGDTANAITSIQNDLLAVGTQLHFKTGNGANIIKEQFIYPADVTIVAGGTFTFTTVAQVWDKLIDIDYFAWLGGGGGGGVDRFDDLLDTFQYTGNAGKAVVVDNSELRLVPITLYNKRLFTELEDTPSSLVPDKMVVVNPAGTALILKDQPQPPEQFLNSVGYFDYNDLATQTTPLSAVANVALKLTNDTEGANTSTDQNPYGVSYVWDYATNQFNFSELEVGDTIDVRIHVQVTTTTSNQRVLLSAKFGIGSVSEFTNIIYENQFKTAGLHEVNFLAPFYMGSTYITDNPAELYLTTDSSATVKVDGWYVRILRKNINIITVDYQVEDATTTTKGIVRLAGDLSGTANNPTVPELANKVPNTRTVSTTSPLLGGGALSSNLTLSIQQANSVNSGFLTYADWTRFDEAHNDRIVSAAVTGTTTKTLRLNQHDGGFIETNWSDDNSVTSVFGRTGAVVAVSGDYTTSLVTEGSNLYYTEARVSANIDVAANTAKRHDAATLGTSNGLSLSGQVLSLALSNATTTGALSSTDWSTFNNKQNALSGSGIVKSVGGTISYLTDNTANWDDAYNNKITTAAVTGTATKTLTLNQHDGGTVTASWTDNNTGVWGTITGTLSDQTDLQNALGAKVPTSRTITINGIGYDLSANVNFNIGVGVWGQITGTLSNQTDLQSALNAKQNSLSGTGFVKISGSTISYDNSTYVPTSRTITINGTSYDLSANRSWTVSGGIGGTGSPGYVAFWNGTSNQAGDSNLFWDNTNKRLGIGTTSPSSMLHARASGFPTLTLEGSTNSGAGIRFFGDVQYAEIFGEYQSSGNGQMFFRTRNAGTISTAMTILSSGNVGIGTTSPTSKLHVDGNIYSSGYFNSNNIYLGKGSDLFTGGSVNDGGLMVSGSNNLIFGNALTERMRITSGGNVGIGTSSPTIGKLQINAVAGTDTFLALNSSNTGSGCGNILFNENGTSRWNIGTTADNSLQIYNQGVNAALYIRKSDSNVGIGTTSPAQKLDVIGIIRASNDFEQTGNSVFKNTSYDMYLQTDAAGAGIIFRTSGATERMRIASNGAVTVVSTITASGGFFNSDIRLKDLTEYDYNISDIKPIAYFWKDGRDDKKHVGYSAQEVQKVMPDAVNEGTDGMLSVNYVEVLVAQVELLNNRMAEMEKEIELLKSK